MRIIKFFQGRIGLVKLVLLGGIIGFSFSMSSPVLRLGKLSTISDGVLTCFQRIHQSYTAKLFGSTASEYLSAPFITSSEECFSEIIYQVDNGFKMAGHDIYKGLNHLASNVHWFHQKLQAKDSVIATGNDQQSEKIDVKFRELERAVSVLMDNLFIAKEEIQAKQLRMKKYFYLSSLLLLMFMVLEYFYNLRKKVMKQVLEDRAQHLLKDGKPLIVGNVEQVIADGLKLAGLGECQEVFTRFNDDIMLNSKIHREYDEDRKIEEVPMNNESEHLLQEKDHQILKSKNVIVGVKLENALSNVIDNLSSKLFTYGIVLDIKLNNELLLLGDREGLEHVFFHSFISAINLCKEMSSARKITISGQAKGKSIIVEFVCSGTDCTDKAVESVDLTICKELMGEYLGGCEVKSLYDDQKMIVGYKLAFSFKNGESTNIFKKTKRLTEIRRGRKKDFIKQNSLSS